MDATLGLRVRHALDAVDAALEFQSPENAVAANGRDDLLIAAHIALGDALDLHLPPAVLGVSLVHPKQVAREERRLVAAGSCADLQDGGGVFIGVARREQEGKFALKVRKSRVERGDLFGRQSRHFRVPRGLHLFQLPAIGARLGKALGELGHRLELGVFLAETHDLRAVTDGAHARLDLAEPVEHLIETSLGETHEDFFAMSWGRSPSARAARRHASRNPVG